MFTVRLENAGPGVFFMLAVVECFSVYLMIVSPKRTSARRGGSDSIVT